MWHVIAWIVVSALLALWSFAAWALHGIGAWTLANAGTLAGGAGAMGKLKLPEWLAPWIPAETTEAVYAAVSALVPVLQSALNQVPALDGAWGVAVGVVWGIGALLLLALGLLMSTVIAVMRRSAAAAVVPAPVQSLAR